MVHTVFLLSQYLTFNIQFKILSEFSGRCGEDGLDSLYPHWNWEHSYSRNQKQEMYVVQIDCDYDEKNKKSEANNFIFIWKNNAACIFAVASILEEGNLHVFQYLFLVFA